MLPPGSKAPRLVQTLRWIRDPISVLEGSAARYGTPFTMRVLAKPAQIVFSDPEHVREILTAPQDLLLTGPANMGFRTYAGPASVLTLDGPEHTRHRRLFQPPLRADRMPAFAETIWNETVRVMDTWPEHRTFRIQEPMYDITLELILQTVFGSADTPRGRELRQVIGQLGESASSTAMFLPILRTNLGGLTRWGRFLRGKAAFGRLLREEIRAAAEDPGQRTDILASLVRQREHDPDALTDEEISDEFMSILAVGHATTTGSLAWTFQWILADPEVHRRVIEEIRERVPDGFDVEALGSLPYLDAVIQESLRISPPVLLVARHLARPATLCGLDLPADVLLRPCPHLTHHDPKVFPEPGRFDPERFLGKRHSAFEYYPFGGGSRTCMGLSYALYQMRVVLAAVFSRVELSMPEAATREVARMAALVCPKHGTPVRVERRLAPVGTGPAPAALGARA